MGHSSIRLKVRRRKVANLAAQSRQYTVRNNTIPKSKYEWNVVPFNTWLDRMPRFGDVKVGGTAYRIDSKGNIVFKNDAYKHEKHPQYKPMMKKHTELIYNKETHITEKVKVASTFPTKKYDDIQKSLWKNLGKAAKMKAYEDEKMKKWERKHPKPCPTDDLFKEEFIPMWEKEREEALIHIRDFVVSMFDKLKVTASLIPPLPSKEILLAKIKDRGDDKNIKAATKIAKQAMEKNKHILHCQLLDHKEKSYRLVA